jgi:hypothetical protein
MLTHLPRRAHVRRCLLFAVTITAGLGAGRRALSQEAGFDDAQNMREQLGITRMRGGASPSGQGEGFDEAKANPYSDTVPDALTMNDRTNVTSAAEWPQRRAELVELFER